MIHKRNMPRKKKSNHITNSIKMKNHARLSAVVAEREQTLTQEVLMRPEKQIKSNKNSNKNIIVEKANIRMMMIKIRVVRHLPENKALKMTEINMSEEDIMLINIIKMTYNISLII